MRRFLFLFYSWKKSFLVIIIIFICHFSFTRLLIFYYQDFDSRTPLILLYTYNYSIKTRNNICQGNSNGGHVVNFDKCTKKCEFSCRIEDFKQRSPNALLFFGEDFYWSFKLTDRNRSSFEQRWIFWSWEAPLNHPEYTRSQLTFNWFAKKCYFYCFFYSSYLGQ
jgi:hypothetical protein